MGRETASTHMSDMTYHLASAADLPAIEALLATCPLPGEVIAIPSSVPHAVWIEDEAVTAVDAWSPVMRKCESPGSKSP